MIKEFFKRVLRMFSKNDIESVFGIELERSPIMEGKISEWLNLYRGGGDEMRLAAAIASETARLVTLELKSEISGSARADYLMERYRPFLERIRNVTELAAACGGVILKPYTTADGIAADVVRADRFIPVTFDDDGRMTGVVTIDKKQKERRYFTRLEYARMTDEGYSVSNRAFVSDNSSDLGRRVPLTAVSDWAELAEDVTLENVKAPLFAYFKMPMANNVDPDSPLGVSVFAGATTLIADAADQWERFKWEFESADRFLGISADMLRRDSSGSYNLPKREERLMRLFEWDKNSGEGLFQDWSPSIREQNYISGLNEIFRRIEYTCSLAYGALSNVQEVEKTAEEIKYSKQRSYSYVSDIQKALRTALIQLIDAMDTFATLYDLAPEGVYQTSFEFDDSIVADRTREFQERMDLVSAGAMAVWELRMWYTGETEEQAREACGAAADITEEAE